MFVQFSLKICLKLHWFFLISVQIGTEIARMLLILIDKLRYMLVAIFIVRLFLIALFRDRYFLTAIFSHIVVEITVYCFSCRT